MNGLVIISCLVIMPGTSAIEQTLKVGMVQRYNPTVAGPRVIAFIIARFRDFQITSPRILKTASIPVRLYGLLGVG